MFCSGWGGEGCEDLGQQKIKSPFGGAAAGEHDRAAATARVMVNCAGLNASAVARAVEAPTSRAFRTAIRQGQLFRTWGPRSVRTSDLSGAAGARSRGAFDFRPRWTGALRPGRRVGRCDRLRRQPGEERGFRRRHSPLLARTAKPRLDAGLFRHPAETRWTERPRR